jgi:multicomponent Na+:H+ antiporter subunit C
MSGSLVYVFCALLLAVGLYAMTVKKNVIKVIVGVVIMHNAINLFLVLVGYRTPPTGEAVAPIVVPGRLDSQALVERSVDPLPQALVLTAIVIGLSVVALMVVMAVRLHEKYGTFDLTEIRRLRG